MPALSIAPRAIGDKAVAPFGAESHGTGLDRLLLQNPDIAARVDELADMRDRAEGAVEANAIRAVHDGAVALLSRLQTVERVDEVAVRGDPAKVAAKAAADVAELKRQAANIGAAVQPKGVLKARARAEVRALADAGRPSARVLLTGRTNAVIAWPRFGLPQVDGRVPGNIPSVPDAAALAAWAFGDGIIEALEAEIDAAYDASDAVIMSPEEQRDALAKIAADVLAAERIEATALWTMHRDGEVVAWRGDINPRAVLGIA